MVIKFPVRFRNYIFSEKLNRAWNYENIRRPIPSQETERRNNRYIVCYYSGETRALYFYEVFYALAPVDPLYQFQKRKGVDWLRDSRRYATEEFPTVQLIKVVSGVKLTQEQVQSLYCKKNSWRANKFRGRIVETLGLLRRAEGDGFRIVNK